MGGLGPLLPARELGGDLYDFYDIGENVLGLAIGDVAGKGVPAALYGAFASGTVRARAFEKRTPADAAGARQPHAAASRRRGHLLHADLRALRLLHTEGAARQLGPAVSASLPRGDPPCAPIEIAGIPLGAFDDSTYEERALAVETGDIFVFHTDGVTEARNGREAYGVERLVASSRRTRAIRTSASGSWRTSPSWPAPNPATT